VGSSIEEFDDTSCGKSVATIDVSLSLSSSVIIYKFRPGLVVNLNSFVILFQF
jgi:hypothetical protein